MLLNWLVIVAAAFISWSCYVCETLCDSSLKFNIRFLNTLSSKGAIMELEEMNVDEVQEWLSHNEFSDNTMESCKGKR